MKETYYTNKLPKDCFECPLFHAEQDVFDGNCGIAELGEVCFKFEDAEDSNCPLKSTEEFTKTISSLRQRLDKKTQEFTELKKQVKK